MTKSLDDIALELLESESNNGFGIRCDAVSAACAKYQVKFKDLWYRVMFLGNRESQ